MKKKMKKKSHNFEKKTERGTFWYFSASILPQNSRKNEGGTFAEPTAEKCKRGPFGIF